MKKIDFHIHVNDPIPIDETVENIKDMMARCGYDGVGIMSLNYHDAHDFLDYGCNERALLLREKLPGSYAFAALDHRRDFVEQAKEFMAMGFDGIKMLEGKPSEYRRYGYGMDDERFEPFFAYAEKEQIPLMIHNNDPAHHWDPDKVTDRMRERGWFYDETMPSRQWFFDVMENILARHPYLRAALAHAGFYADRLETADRLLDACPNLRLDLTPALIIFAQFSRQPDAPAFFKKHIDRLTYGTDADNDLTGPRRELNDKKVRIMKHFYEGSDEEVMTYKTPIISLRLDEKSLAKIYAENALAFMKK